MKITKLVIAAALFIATAVSIQATVLMGNIPLANESATPDSLTASSWYTVGVTTANDATTRPLQNMRLDLTVSSGNPTIEIRSGATPPTTTGFNSFTFGNIGNVWTATPSAGFNFLPNTTYWVVVGATGLQTGSWLGSSPAGTYSLGLGASFVGTFPSGSGGGSWSYPFPAGGNPGLEVNAVPEPQEYAMLAGLGLVAFALWRRTMAAKIA